MIIGMPVITQRCPSGHLMTSDNVCSIGRKRVCRRCVARVQREGAMIAGRLVDASALEHAGIEYVRVDGEVWIPAGQLRLAYEGGMTVRNLMRLTGRNWDLIRSRIVADGGVLRRDKPSSTAVREREPSRDPELERRALIGLRAADGALAARRDELLDVALMNRDVARLASEIESDVHWSDHGDWEPRPDLSALHHYEGRPPRRINRRGDGVLVMVTLTEEQRARLSLLANGARGQSSLVRRLLDEHVVGSDLPTDSRGGHDVRFPLNVNTYERERLREIAEAEGLSMSALMRALVTRAAEGSRLFSSAT